MLNAALNKRYHIGEELGQGGMGVVYRAWDSVLEREVAVKVVSTSELGTDGRARLLQEARAAASLNHPHIVAVYDAMESDGTGDGAAYIVMELVEGSSLRTHKAADFEEKMEIARQACSALIAAHEKGIIHRDLKPENVLVRPATSGERGITIKLVDFGLARISGGTRLTQGEALIGTIAYLAPELILGRPASQQSDLYALGMMLYELFAGRPPFEGDNPAVLLTNHLHATVVPPGAFDETIPAALDSLIVQLLAKEPDRRPASAAEVFEALEDLRQPEWSVAAEEFGAPALLGHIARGRLVGRDKELAQATGQLLRALEGESHLLLISGEPGIGKTRLAQAIIAQAEIAGARIFKGGCYEYEATTPYLPVAEALREWASEQDDETLRQALGPVAAELSRLAPEIRERLGDVGTGPSLSPNEERLRLYDSVARFLTRQAAGRALAFFIDDLHWADAGTLALLSYLLRRLRDKPLFLLATYREIELDRKHPLAAALVEWNRERLATRIHLTRLGIKETNAMLATLFGQKQVSVEFAEAIHRDTEGNPFFIEEVAKSLVEQGQIYRVGDRWERTELSELAIPQSIKEAIGRRLNQLSESCIAVLHMAAVIGKDFPFDVLVAVASAGEDEVLDALEEASTAQLIRPAGAESFVFTHDKIREVLYDELISIRRNRLHGRIGQALEARLKDQTGALVADLAYHFVAAGNLEKGLDYSMRAAERAAQLYAHDEAIKYLDLARECAVSLEKGKMVSDIDVAIADTYGAIGLSTKAYQAYQRAMGTVQDELGKAVIKTKLGGYLTHLGDARGHELLLEAIEELNAETQPNDLAAALTSMGRYLHQRSRYRDAIDYYQRARSIAEPLAEAVTLTLIYSFLAGAYQHLALWDESLKWAQACINLGKRYDYPYAMAIGYEFIAENYGATAQWERAFEAAVMDHRIGVKVGSLDRMSWATTVQGWVHWGKGSLNKAVELLHQSLELVERTGDRRLEVITAAYLVHALTDLGDDESAYEYAKRFLMHLHSIHEPQLRALAKRTIGYYHASREEWDLALPYFQEDYEILAGTDYALIGYAESHLAKALFELGHVDEAAKWVASALESGGKAEQSYVLGQSHVVRGRVAAARGKEETAKKAFSEAIRIHEKSGSSLELGRAYFQWGRWAMEMGQVDAARVDLERAMILFEKSEASRDLARVAQLLAE